MTAPTRRAALSALASVPALAIPAPAAIAAAGPSVESEDIVTTEQMAAMNFEPWTHTEGEWEPPSNAEWAKDGAYLLPFVRLAWICMFKTKAELETIATGLGDERFEELVNGIHHSLEFFENFVPILKSAEARIMCAATAVALRDGSLDETS